MYRRGFGCDAVNQDRSSFMKIFANDCVLGLLGSRNVS